MDDCTHTDTPESMTTISMQNKHTNEKKYRNELPNYILNNNHVCGVRAPIVFDDHITGIHILTSYSNLKKIQSICFRRLTLICSLGWRTEIKPNKCLNALMRN